MPSEDRPLPKRAGRRSPAFLLVVLCLALSVIGWLAWRMPARPVVHAGTATAPTRPVASTNAVGCLGYIEPKNGLLEVMASYFEGHPQVVLQLKVVQGERVRKGQLLAVLDGRDRLQSEVRLAGARVNLARARLDQVKAGASASEIAAQRAAVQQAQSALDHARSEYRRLASLRRGVDIAPAKLDSQRLSIDTDTQILEAAKQRLENISQVRPSDVAVAQSELDVAIAEEETARLNMKSAFVYAPAAGRVVDIYAYPGEQAGPHGLLDIAKTDSMYVVAEVYETDIGRVHPGESAAITSDLFSGTLSGMVEDIDSAITKTTILPTNPVAFADTRVFKVWIRLDNSAPVAGLIHGKVNVVIHS